MKKSTTEIREPIQADCVYLTNEAAKIIRVQPSTIREAVRTGKIKGRGRPYRVLGAELFKLL